MIVLASDRLCTKSCCGAKNIAIRQPECMATFPDDVEKINQATFLRARFAGAGFFRSVGLRPRPMVFANAERAAA
jgi:hypothetical protein